eukprot:CAMPEP_0179193194 /NCGR_PEP_ID=MMETSP0796-20121207/96001_1 /TAXON_ID=73915 /ORGANISM="Pyrodinium bahamense, Strain pbaha01" /LENGTH=73 /DNA_ID=CAMNT_0020897491 /DNA_START=43 /DNA_END=260 /DNA_ORIENTATION=+
MALEDGLSLLSFAVGLLYLHHTNGAPLALLAKRMAPSPEGAAATAAVFGATEEDGSGPPQAAEPPRLGAAAGA